MATYYVRTDGSDSNAGTGSATNQAWQTITKAIGATGIAPGDTLYIAPGVYRGAFAAGFTTPSSEGQRITIAGNPTASQFSGVTAGPVIITNWTSSTSASGITLDIAKSFVTVQDVFITGYQPSSGATIGLVISSVGTYQIYRRCGFYGVNQSGDNYSHFFAVANGFRGPTIEDCAFIGHAIIRQQTNTGTAYNSQTIIRNNVFLNASSGSNTLQCLTIDSGGTSPVFGGVNVTNCRFMGNTGIRPVSNFRISTSFPVVVQNCIFDTVSGIVSSNTGDFIESYNLFNCTTERTNVATGTGSLSRAFVSPDYSLSRVSGWGNLPFWSNHFSSASQNAGINTNSDTVDFYGVTWLAPSTPTMGPIEYFSNTSTGSYIPTERNASTITIAPGSTSQSIELYLGATGLTASTSGLSARYNRTRTASVSIPLVARTIAQEWTSGGFAEVDATNMPGVYRLDLPDAALAAGADDVTVVVRGASGTNGAVMTVKLSSGGLTSAQTASAVWGASNAGYTGATTFGGVLNEDHQLAVSTDATVNQIPNLVWDELTSAHTVHGSYGYNSLRADAPSKEGLVTLHQSGGISRVDADIHAIVNDYDAAVELKGALLHNGIDYISANLLTPITSAINPVIGPFTVLPAGAGADNIVDLNVGTAAPLALNLLDGNGAPFNASGSTITATVYTAGGSTVTTYTGSIVAGYIGAISIPLDATTTGTSATYTMLVSVVIGTTTTVFGPLKLVVRAI